jgi:hypothetical protein
MKIEKGLRFIDGCYNMHTVTSADENGFLHEYYDGNRKRHVESAFMYRIAFERLVRRGAIYVIKEKSADDLWAQAIGLVKEQAMRDFKNGVAPCKNGMNRISKIHEIILRYSENISEHFGNGNISNENFKIKVAPKVYMV